MPTYRIPAAPLTGGVSRQPQPNRSPTQTQTADNAMLHMHRLPDGTIALGRGVMGSKPGPSSIQHKEPRP